MKYSKFEDLPVGNDAICLGNRVFDLVEDKAFHFQGYLRKQLASAGLSVSNNIAEGFERETTKELLNFLRIARGSAGEVRSMLHLINRNQRYGHLESERAELMADIVSISKQLQAWAVSLQRRL